MERLYFVDEESFGCTIIRLSDNASVWLQGNDYDEFIEQYWDCENEYFQDYLCGQYDHIMGWE